MSTKKVVIIGCSAAAALAMLLFVVLIAGLIYVAQDVEGAAVSANSPLDVTVGETFDLTVEVRNERQTKVLELSDVDIGEEYLAGFTVVSIDPEFKSTMHVPIDNSRSYTFGVTIPAGEARTFTFTLRAEKAGIYRGDVDACEGARFITAMAQTVVKDK